MFLVRPVTTSPAYAPDCAFCAIARDEDSSPDWLPSVDGKSPRDALRRRLGKVSQQPASQVVSILEELARDQHAQPVRDIAELRADVWDSDKELDEFLADWRASRDASLS